MTMPEAPECPGPDPAPRPPRSFLVPDGAVDTHAHVIGAPPEYPRVDARSYTPPPAPPSAYLRMLDATGMRSATCSTCWRAGRPVRHCASACWSTMLGYSMACRDRTHRRGDMSRYELAQLNIATMKEPLESPGMADFVANLDRINALAEASGGFVWRLQTEEGDATALRPMGENTLVNMSVWRDVASLNGFVYRSAHVEIMRRRKEWFERMSDAYLVLWWVPKGHRPSIDEALARLALLRNKGATAEAFTFRQAFDAPDALAPRAPVEFGDPCPAT